MTDLQEQFTLGRSWWEITDKGRISMADRVEVFMTSERAREVAVAWIRQMAGESTIVEPSATIYHQRLTPTTVGRGRNAEQILTPARSATLMWTVDPDGIIKAGSDKKHPLPQIFNQTTTQQEQELP